MSKVRMLFIGDEENVVLDSIVRYMSENGKLPSHLEVNETIYQQCKNIVYDVKINNELLNNQVLLVGGKDE